MSSGRESKGRSTPPPSTVIDVTRSWSLISRATPKILSKSVWGPAMPKVDPSGACTSKPADVKWAFTGAIDAMSLAGTDKLTFAETQGSCIIVLCLPDDGGGLVAGKLSDGLLYLAGLDARSAD